MIIAQYYLTEKNALARLLDLTDLAADEVEQIVGRFHEHHYRFAGLLRGEVLEHSCGKVVIRHHFTKKKLVEIL